jgi:hypothetical protein
LWDVGSQKCRHLFSGKVRAARPVALRPEPAAARIRKPEKASFGVLEPVGTAA